MKFGTTILALLIGCLPICPAGAVEKNAAATASGATFGLTKTITIPFEYVQKELLVKVRINGSEPLDFLFDTGASDVIVDRQIAADHFLDKQGDFDISGPTGTVATQSSVIERLQLGGLTLENLPGLIVDLSGTNKLLSRPVAGVLGISLMNRFVVTIDFAKQVIVLAEPAAWHPPEATAHADFGLQAGPVVKAMLNGKTEQYFLIDTGSQFNYLPSSVAAKFSSEPAAATQGGGLDGKQLNLSAVNIDTLDLAGIKVRQQKFAYARGENLEQTGYFKKTNLGVLGNPFWQNFVFSLDFKARRLYLQLSQVQKSRQEVAKLLAAADSALTIQRDYRTAESQYQKALLAARQAQDPRDQAVLYGRIGNLRRIMAKDLKRPQQLQVAQAYFTQALTAARKIKDRQIEGRILADWSLLYSDLGQAIDASQAIESALALSPNDAQVNVDYAVHLYRGGVYQQMQKYIERSLTIDPANWQALWYQVRLSEIFQDSPKQLETLREILRRYPFSKLAQEKIKALQSLAPTN